ncbi:helix-turn-helix domain-containing protein [Enterocloster clostridioformis]|uniref:helix-turn-helix domain-containing protein n=1 Tax=Enterocloster clostridioformis TaxID=1531 RepID=UPI001F1771F8|nr:helix-turn-helix domain-containing protein [Enterocloster clostridioformis]MCF2704836.1 helix-turn-helix domain-containing protein [Enterocloster clostridioformis]
MFEEKIEELNKRIAEQKAVEMPAFEKRVYSVDEIQDILSIGRTSAYNLVKQNLFHVVHIGGTIRISKKSFDEWLDSQL